MSFLKLSDGDSYTWFDTGAERTEDKGSIISAMTLGDEDGGIKAWDGLGREVDLTPEVIRNLRGKFERWRLALEQVV